MNQDQREQLLLQLGEELRVAFAAERVAIGKLDSGKLAELAVHKRAIADQLAQLRSSEAASREVRDLFAALRIDARATAMLAAVAGDAVRNLLGYEATGYDKRARRTATTPRRIVATY